MYLSDTALFDGRYMSGIYYVRYNYMFRRLTISIFRLYMKYLAVIRDLWPVYSGEVRWARDLVCVMEFGRCGYMGFLLLYVYLN